MKFTPYREPVVDHGSVRDNVSYRIAVWDGRDLAALAGIIWRGLAVIALSFGWLLVLGEFTPLVTVAPPEAWGDAAATTLTQPSIIALSVAYPIAIVLHEATHAAVLGAYTDATIHVRMFQFAADEPHSAVYHFRWMDEQLPWHTGAVVGLSPLWLLALAAGTWHMFGVTTPSVAAGVLIGIGLGGLPSPGDIGMVRHAVFWWDAGGYEPVARDRHAAVHG